MPKENSTPWEIFTEPGAVFRFLNSNKVEFEIDMKTDPRGPSATNVVVI